MKISVRRLIIVTTLLLFGIGLGISKYAFDQIGKSPGELMDYAERRLIGHPKLEFFALPAMHVLRRYFNAPALEERKASLFFIDKPPILRTDSTDESFLRPLTSSKVIRVSKNGPIYTVAKAAALAQNGDVIEIESGNYFGDVTIWHQSKLTIRGVGGAARLYANGEAAEGKAIWVFRNGDFDISNIDFMNTRVPDHNGAGIRFEGGNLSIRNCLFWGNENGLLVNSNEQTTVSISDSEFGYNGHVDGRSHSIYIGYIKSLKVTGSYFHHGNVGHLIKSRAQTNTITYNRITDESGGRASYEIDLSNGGKSLVVGNIIQQTQATENSTIIAYGLEGYVWPDNSLIMVSNTIVNDLDYGGIFLRAKEGPRQITSANNLFVGNGRLSADAPFVTHNDQYTDWSVFAKANLYDYRLNQSGQRFTFDATLPQQAAPTPDRQYLHPHSTLPLTHAPRYAGAVQ